MSPVLAGPRGVLRPISVAPMMDRTDRHFRWLLRRVTRRALLYTEMVTTGAVLHGDREQVLGFDPDERPLALQLGGDDPTALAACARIAEDLGYDEVNLNVGCPSSRVQEGSFGACLMRRPERVAEAVAAMRDAVGLPVTVKHRIGVDELDRYEDMARFVAIVAEAGADRFTVHARKAWLQGLSPKENREVPPLRHADVHRLKRERPDLLVEINGGLRSVEAYRDQLRHVDAVMVGRAAWDDPFHLVSVDPDFFGASPPVASRREVVEAAVPWLEAHLARGGRAVTLVRPLLNLYTGVPGAKRWKRILTEGTQRGAGDATLLLRALDAVEQTGALTRRGQSPTIGVSTNS